MFDSTKEDLVDLLKAIDKCSIQLPDFQRDWVWADEDIKSLLASIARGFPVGAILTLRTGGEVEFKPRPITGAEDQGKNPAELLLDGQQRMTSLFQSMYLDKPVRTKDIRGHGIERYYYIDIKKACSGEANFDEIIVGVPANRVRKNAFGRDIELDLSNEEQEYKNNMFPMNKVFDERKWLREWREHWKDNDVDVDEMERLFCEGTLDIIRRYEVPIIRLNENNSREAICLIFEKVNVGGKKLDAFELLTAIFAAEGFDLRKDWLGEKQPEESRRKRIQGIEIKQPIFDKIASTEFIQACTILHTVRLHIKWHRCSAALREGMLTFC
jgi:uncharacterized protein with ParB-like and HNH nuclease domain